MWIQAKTLHSKLHQYLRDTSNESLRNEFLSELKKNSQRLLNPLINQAKSSNSAAILNRSKIGQLTELPGGAKVVLTEGILQDAESLSELFDLDLLIALELILCGETQKKNYRDLSRGLCSVICYYDAHLYYLLVTNTLLQLRSDGAFEDFVPEELAKFIDSFFESVDFFEKCLKVYDILEKRTDFEKLYQYQFSNIISDIESTTYEIICALAVNCPVQRQVAQLQCLFGIITKAEVDLVDRRLADPSKPVDKKAFRIPDLALWTALAVFISPVRLRGCGSNCDEIFEIFESHLKERWANRQVRASILFCYAISVKCTVGNYARRGKLETADPLEDAIEYRALHFILQHILTIPNINGFVMSIQVVDCYIKHFISYCPEKLQEIFNVCEEELITLEDPEFAKIGQLKDFGLHFQVLLRIITAIYVNATEDQKRLAEQYFDPNYELSSFIASGTSISSPALYVDYIDMIRALCQTNLAARGIYEQFKNGRDSLYDWANLFSTLRSYIQEFRRSHVPFHNIHLANSVFQPVPIQQMSADELAGMVAWIRLANRVAEVVSLFTQEPDARRDFVLDHHFNTMETLILGSMTRFPLVLKKELYKFLAVLATAEGATVQMWAMLKSHGVCEFNETTQKLTGIQNELEEVECAEKQYDSSEGFLHLVKALFSRKNFNVADVRVMVPYVQFVIKSIVCQFDQRAYNNTIQMWELVSTGMDALYELLRRFHISSVSVARRGPQIFVLSQLLNDSELSRAVIRVLTECANVIEDTIVALSRRLTTPQWHLADAKNRASLSALRLLSHACVVSGTVRAAFRTAAENSPIYIASLESLLLTPLPSSPTTNYIQLLSAFLDEQPLLIRHSYYIVRILSELCEKATPDVHRALLETMSTNTAALQCIFAQLTYTRGAELEVNDEDVVRFDLEGVEEKRLRGEIARDVFNMVAKILTNQNDQVNSAHLLFGFNLKDIHASPFGVVDEDQSLNCMNSLLAVLEALIATERPEQSEFMMLFEPALKVLLKLVAVDSISCTTVLQFLRNGADNMVLRLAKCPLFQSTNEDVTEFIQTFCETSIHNQSHDDVFPSNLSQLEGRPAFSAQVESFRRSCRGLILELVAVDFSVAMASGHLNIGREYLELLLASKNDTQEWGLIWSLIQNSISASLEIQTPRYSKFDIRKMQDVLDLCLRHSAITVDQYDVEYLHFLLSQEISAISNEDTSEFKRDANEILLYCCQYNAQRRLEGSCVQLLSGWIALINADLYFSPLPFIPIEPQQQFCTDSLILLKEYVQKVDMNEEVLGGVSNCCFALVRQLVDFACVQHETEDARKLALGEVLNLLISCVIMPSYNRHSLFKMNIYASIMCVIQACTDGAYIADKEAIERFQQTGSLEAKTVEKAKQVDMENLPLTEKNPNCASFFGLIDQRATIQQTWSEVFRQNATELVETCASDIEFAPFDHKVLAISCLSEMLREDKHSKQSLAHHLARLGVVKALLDSLPTVCSADFGKTDAEQDKDNVRALQMLQVVLAFFTRLTNCQGGYKILGECNALRQLSHLALWKKPPRAVFFVTTEGVHTDDKNKTGIAQLYLGTVDGLFKLCEAAAATIYKKAASADILECISAHVELLNHLKRQADVEAEQHPLIKTALRLADVVESVRQDERRKQGQDLN